eukprot:12101-Pleurochrysis_carterae.AAC.1
MGEDKLALQKAVAYADAELVSLLLLHLRARRAPAELFELLRPHALAQRLLVRYCLARDRELLKAFFYHADRPADAAALALEEGYGSTRWAQRARGISVALHFYEHCGKEGAARVCDSQLRLLEAQRVLEREAAAAEHKAAAQTSASAPASAPASASVSASAPRFRFVDLPLNAT